MIAVGMSQVRMRERLSSRSNEMILVETNSLAL